MKRKTQQAGTPPPIKTTIAIADVLMRFAESRIAAEGHNSFSSYVAHLVRKDKERAEALEIARGQPGRYPEHRPQYSTTEDRPASSAAKEIERKAVAVVKREQARGAIRPEG